MTPIGWSRVLGAAVTLVLASSVANATTTVVQPSNQDAYLRQDKPNHVFGNSTVDRIEIQSSTPSPRIERGLVQFDLSMIPQFSTVTSATLDLYQASSPVSPARTHGVYKVLESWLQSGVKWNTTPSAVAAPTATQSVGPVRNVFYSFVVGGDVQAWVNDPNSNHGWLVKDQAETTGNDTIAYTSRDDAAIPEQVHRPKLTITYTAPSCTTDAQCADANACTINEHCAGGVCVVESLNCDDGNLCTDDICDPQQGCMHPIGICNDGFSCTIDACTPQGGCTHTPVDAVCLHNGCQTGTCVADQDDDTLDPVTGCHVTSVAPNGTGCNDQNGCTQSDTCSAGECVGSSPVTCSALDACHVAGTCSPGTGLCSNPPAGAGTSCSDGSACTQTDQCDGNGTCVGSNPVVCTALDQCHDVGTCNPGTGVCSNPNKTNGSVCNDGNACTQTDQCSAGSCVGGNPVVCTALDQCHDPGTCNTGSGVCSNPAKADGSGCSDGNGCTQTDTCTGGVCNGGNPVVCTPLDQCHLAGTCNPGSGTCSNPTKPDGSTCSDGNACTQTDQCSGGTCAGGNPVVCTALDQCHDVGTCSPGTGVCSNPNKVDGTTCNDGNACTQGDTCTGGSCSGGTAVVCTPLDQCHDVGTCDTGTGLCSNPAKADGAACNDGNSCTQTDRCTGGSCGGSNPVVCSALDQCHDVGTCDTGTGVCSNPPKTSGTGCDDGSACTQTDQCDGGGACVGGNAVVCTPQDDCHLAGTCDPQTGTCSNPTAGDGTTCSDGNACTLGDTCTGGACTGMPTTCGNGTVEPACNEECDDPTPGANCTPQCRFICGPTPDPGCLQPAAPKKAVVVLKDKSPDKRDSMLFKYVKGAATALPDFGDPLNTTGYTLCVYDSSVHAQPLILAMAPAGGTCLGKPCWKTVKNGYRYKDKELTPDGVQFILEKSGIATKSKVIVKGKGANLGMTTLPLTTPVTVQFKRTDAPATCWQAIYSTPIKNLPEQFKAKAD